MKKTCMDQLILFIFQLKMQTKLSTVTLPTICTLPTELTFLDLKVKSVKIEKLATRHCYFCDKYFSIFAKFKTHTNCCSEIGGFI